MTLASPGDPLNIPAIDWNELQAMLLWWKRRGKQSSGIDPALSAIMEQSQTRCLVRNTSTTDRNRHEILGLTHSWLDDAYNDFKNHKVLRGATPTTADHAGRFCVTLEPIPKDQIGWAVVSGMCHAKLSVTTSADKFAEVTNNNGTFLTTGNQGSAQVYHPATGTGQKLGIVRIGIPFGEILVKNGTGSDIAINSSGTFQIWTGTPGSEADTGRTITAYNKTSVAFKNGKFGSVGVLNGYVYAVPWQT